MINKIKNQQNFATNKTKVFIMAGGRGNRLKPFTSILPKPLMPVNNKPIISIIMENFKKYGFDDFIVSLYDKANIIKLYLSLKQKQTNITYVEESYPLGTAGSLKLAENILKDTFFIANSDTIICQSLDKILQYHKKNQNIMTLTTYRKKILVPYGVLKISEDKQIYKIDEKPYYCCMINAGLYVAEPIVLEYIKKNKKVDINTIINLLIKDNKKVCAYEIQKDSYFDIGQFSEYKRTLKNIRKNKL